MLQINSPRLITKMINDVALVCVAVLLNFFRVSLLGLCSVLYNASAKVMDKVIAYYLDFIVLNA